MKLAEIPKFVIWGAIATFIVILLYLTYLTISYKFFKPYQKFMDIDCEYLNNTAIVIITAKADINNISITDLDYKNKCKISYLSKDSMDVCKIHTKKIDSLVLVRILFNYNNRTYKVVEKCEVKKRRGLFDILR